MSPGWLMAIDFGTSNTAAAHTSPISGSVETLPLSHHGNLMPSGVFIESPDRIFVGEVALNRAASNPAAFVAAPKRMFGTSVITANGYDVPIEAPAAAILASVIERAVRVHGGVLPDHVVLTHPEDWSQRQLDTLLAAAGVARIPADRVSLISEPRAAAHYYTRTEVLSVGERIAVFDYGGGTLDVAVLEATAGGTFAVSSAKGDGRLGGKNIDRELRRWVDDQLQERNPGLLSFLQKRASADVVLALDDSIRGAKELLSEAAQASIAVVGGGEREAFILTRPEFDSLIGAQVDRAVALARETFVQAGLSGPGDLRAIYLTGGSSRIPLVHEKLSALGRIATLDDPKTVVAQGALSAPSRSGRADGHVAVDDRRSAVSNFTASATPTSATPASATSSRRLRRVAALGVAAVAAIVVGVVVAVNMSSGGDGSTDAATASSDGAAVRSTEGVVSSRSGADIDAVLPAKLRQSVSKPCAKSVPSLSGAYTESCVIDPTSKLGELLGTNPKDRQFFAFVDKGQAAQSVAGSKNAGPEDTVLNSKDGNAVGRTMKVTGGLLYGNQTTGLNVSYVGQRELADKFLRYSGLLD